MSGPVPIAITKYREYEIGRFAQPPGRDVWCIRPAMDDDGIVGFVVSDRAFPSIKAARLGVDAKYDDCPGCPPLPGEPRRGTLAWGTWAGSVDRDGYKQIPCKRCGAWLVWVPEGTATKRRGAMSRADYVLELIRTRAITPACARRVVAERWPGIMARRRAWRAKQKATPRRPYTGRPVRAEELRRVLDYRGMSLERYAEIHRFPVPLLERIKSGAHVGPIRRGKWTYVEYSTPGCWVWGLPIPVVLAPEPEGVQ